MSGRLFIIGTPIGNLSDISRRALDTLAALDILYCEDTRVTAKLLNHFQISLSMRALSDDHGQGRWDDAVREAVEGRRVGYVSDAGMPGVSDPARRLAQAAWQQGIVPTVVPGPSALATLLSACPFVDNAFRFAGFAPRKPRDRSSFAAELAASAEPVFFFEGTNRVHSLLDELCPMLAPERQIFIGREMTKLYEQLMLLHASEWPARKGELPERGEFSLAVSGKPAEVVATDESAVLQAFARLAGKGFSSKDAITAVAQVLQLNQNEVKRIVYSSNGREEA